jgi:hypothetical protein
VLVVLKLRIRVWKSSTHKRRAEMRINKFYIAIGMIIALGLFLEVAAHADERNQETTITFSAPVQIPGQVLPAGTYRFELADPDNGDLDLVHISNADGTVLYATLQTVPTEGADPSGEPVVTLATAESSAPDFLVKWFYPGNTTGHKFIYSTQQEREIAHATQETFLGNQPMSAGFAGGD